MWFRNVQQRLFPLVSAVLINPSASFECGVRQQRINEAIVRGQPTSPGDWPWHAAIYHRGKDYSNAYACGGTLISELFVLTAGHCVKSENSYVLSPSKVFVQLGVHNLLKLDPYTQQHDVDIIHLYDSANNLRNDIALLKLETQAKFNEFVRPACVNRQQDLTRNFGTAVGWGRDETDQLLPLLKSATMPVVSGYQCLENNDGVFRLALDSSLFCAGFSNGTTVCNGDSGGGLHFERKGVWHVGGIIAFTAPRDSSLLCHTESYAAFTNVYKFLPWIRNVTQLRYLGGITGPGGEEIERECADPVQRYEVESFVYPYYPQHKNDIGLIRIATEVSWEYNIQPICLPVTPQLRVRLFKEFIVTGWGLNELYQPHQVLQEAVLPLASNADCQQRSSIDLTERQLCAGGGHRAETGFGDGGGPLGYATNYNGAMRFVQFGVVSLRVETRDGKDRYTIFTRVASYMDWIVENIVP
ncbi:hypothetical protein pipiens_006665 [Culex pipiens pipiens]|uniref:Peptidase S1 domain-containing protein n=1 Tax=Culex pipiens pipiens TaxID=38569 RepID=A0ABD1DNN3_CULPP